MLASSLRVWKRSNALLLVSRGGSAAPSFGGEDREKRERKLGWNGSFKLLL